LVWKEILLLLHKQRELMVLELMVLEHEVVFEEALNMIEVLVAAVALCLLGVGGTESLYSMLGILSVAPSKRELEASFLETRTD